MKQHSKWFSLLFFLITFVVASCIEGDPGPQGDPGAQGDKGAQGDRGEDGFSAYDTLKTGYFRGTITGVRKDGTPFSESFKYNYHNTEDVFGGTNNESIDLHRNDINSPANNYLRMNLKLVDKGLATETLVGRDDVGQVNFSYSTEAEQNKLFLVSASTFAKDIEVSFIELSDDLNDQYYHFNKQGDGMLSIQKNWVEGNPNPTYFIASATYEGVGIGAYYSAAGTLTDVGTPQGPVYSGPMFDLYNQLVIKYNPDFKTHTFYDAKTGESLHGGGSPVPGDKVVISNYSRDLSTGVISFDFEVTVAAKRGANTHGSNSTRHDLIIKGQFNSGSKVYLEVI